MKVIFLENVAKTGKKHEVKNVADGHALNMLIPRGYAEVATPEAIKKLEARKANEEASQKKHAEHVAKMLKTIDGKTYEVSKKLNEKGHLFAALHVQDIAKIINTESKVEIPVEYINLEHPLKDAGKHEIKIAVDGVVATVTIDIVGQ